MLEAATKAEKISRHRTSSVDDYQIQKTNDDATECKKSAIALGYFEDKLVDSFCPHSVDRRTPEINRGYWARVAAVRLLLDRFLKLAGPNCQIINLGSGFDTLYWNLKTVNPLGCFSLFIDTDFASVTAKKLHYIFKDVPMNKQLKEPLTDINIHDHIDLHSADYHLIGADLRDIGEFSAKLESTGIDFNKPTVFLCECVLVYMTTEQSTQLLKYLAEKFNTAAIINYEQVNIGDKFGEVMQTNLAQRGICLAGMKACENLETQKQRFSLVGWDTVFDWGMDFVYDRLPKDEIKRIEHIEFLDERELLTQLLQHYCIVVATKDADNIGLSTLRDAFS